MIEPRTHLDQTIHVNRYDPFRNANTRSENIEPSLNYGTRARKTVRIFENYRNGNGDGVQFRPQNMENESGVSSPPLWKSSPPRATHSGYRHLSPNSRAQAIARGQWELMEMVKDMPESCYELSLKDLVEHPKVASQEACLLEEKYSSYNQALDQRVKVNKQEGNKNEKRVNMTRSRGMDNRGLFLKMFFPFSLDVSKRKNKNSALNTCARVSPKPEDLAKPSKNGDVDWWKKKSSVSSESEIGGSSNISGSTGRSSSSGSNNSSSSSHDKRKRSSLICCWTFEYSKRNTSTE